MMKNKISIEYRQILTAMLIVIGGVCCAGCEPNHRDHNNDGNQVLKMIPLETVAADTEHKRWLNDLPAYSQSYDAARDPQIDLAAAMRSAANSNKLIFMLVGGDWCSWCHVMTRFFSQETVLQQLLLANFEILKINMSETNSNAEFLAGYPEIDGYPHIFILSSAGQLLHSQDTFNLQHGDRYSKVKFERFLRQHANEK